MESWSFQNWRAMNYERDQDQTTSDGGEQTGTVDDLIAAKGTFVRVLCGNSMDDLDRILRYEIPDYFCVID